MKPARRRVFLDTGVLLAAVLPRDPDHAAAVEVLRRLSDGAWLSAHTSDYVLAEALNFLRMKVKRRATSEALLGLVFGDEDAPPALASVLRIHGGRFARALESYHKHYDRGLSLTDWTTLMAMRDAGIDDLATFDRGFRGHVALAPGL